MSPFPRLCAMECWWWVVTAVATLSLNGAGGGGWVAVEAAAAVEAPVEEGLLAAPVDKRGGQNWGAFRGAWGKRAEVRSLEQG